MPRWEGLKDPSEYTEADRMTVSEEALRSVGRLSFLLGQENECEFERGKLRAALDVIEHVSMENCLAFHRECESCGDWATEFDDHGAPLCLGCAWQVAEESGDE